MNLQRITAALAAACMCCLLTAQSAEEQKDSTYIYEIEQGANPLKLLHAEPLYIDLIRDLGARKGEKEWNVGLGLTDRLQFDSYTALVEYEWAPIDRVGLEVELPFTFYSPINKFPSDSLPSNRLNALKVATQWSFFVHEKSAVSMALGYIHEFELSPFREFASPLHIGNTYNPFFIAAKRWGTNFHSLLYSGIQIHQEFSKSTWSHRYEAHFSLHYMIPGTRNFIGLESNSYFASNLFDLTLRPQMRLGITDHLLIGIVAGIPVDRRNERISSFVRLIWEP